MLTALGLGLLLGLRHAFDPDHVAAVSTLTTRHRSPWAASWIGASWGAGHSATILLVDLPVIVLQLAVPDGLSRSVELAVGVLLVALGAANLALAARPRPDGAEPSEGPLGAALVRSGLVGVAHGLAGSAAVCLLATAAMPGPAAALSYLVAFGLGTLGGMVAFSLALGLPLAVWVHGPGARRFATAGAGLLSLGVGAAWLLDPGLVPGRLG